LNASQGAVPKPAWFGLQAFAWIVADGVIVLGYDRFELKSMPLQTIVKTREKTNR